MDKKSPHIQLGINGELIAEKHLRRKGYEVLEKNWRRGKGEIDLICRIGNDIVFVEVKTRTTDYFGFPELSVSRSKQKHLANAAQAWIEDHDYYGEARYDIVAVILNHGKSTVYHIEDAFYPGIG